MGVSAVVGILGALAAVGGTTYSIVNSQQQQKKGEKESELAKQEQARLLKEAQDRQAKEEKALADQQSAASEQAAMEKRNIERSAVRQKQRATGAAQQGRAGTILTSPLGVSGEAPTAGKTILGG